MLERLRFVPRRRRRAENEVIMTMKHHQQQQAPLLPTTTTTAWASLDGDSAATGGSGRRWEGAVCEAVALDSSNASANASASDLLLGPMTHQAHPDDDDDGSPSSAAVEGRSDVRRGRRYWSRPDWRLVGLVYYNIAVSCFGFFLVPGACVTLSHDYCRAVASRPPKTARVSHVPASSLSI